MWVDGHSDYGHAFEVWHNAAPHRGHEEDVGDHPRRRAQQLPRGPGVDARARSASVRGGSTGSTPSRAATGTPATRSSPSTRCTATARSSVATCASCNASSPRSSTSSSLSASFDLLRASQTTPCGGRGQCRCARARRERTQYAVHGSASRRAGEICSPHSWHRPYVPSSRRASAASISSRSARERLGRGDAATLGSAALALASPARLPYWITSVTSGWSSSSASSASTSAAFSTSAAACALRRGVGHGKRLRPRCRFACRAARTVSIAFPLMDAGARRLRLAGVAAGRHRARRADPRASRRRAWAGWCASIVASTPSSPQKASCSRVARRRPEGRRRSGRAPRDRRLGDHRRDRRRRRTRAARRSMFVRGDIARMQAQVVAANVDVVFVVHAGERRAEPAPARARARARVPERRAAGDRAVEGRPRRRRRRSGRRDPAVVVGSRRRGHERSRPAGIDDARGVRIAGAARSRSSACRAWASRRS